MRYLLDTHAFIWWNMQSFRLSASALAICRDKNNSLMLSMASIWEIQIKQQLGKLTLPAPLQDVVENQRQVNHITLLPIELAHVIGLGSLPDYHKDPFDRLLIAQAQVENLRLISNDPHVARYPVQVIW